MKKIEDRRMKKIEHRRSRIEDSVVARKAIFYPRSSILIHISARIFSSVAARKSASVAEKGIGGLILITL